MRRLQSPERTDTEGGAGSGPAPAPMSRLRRAAVPAAIFAAAFGVRAAVSTEAWRRIPFLRWPVIDGADYADRARGVAAGAFWSQNMEIHPPLYGWLLGMEYAVFGDGTIWPFMVQALLGAAACVLLWKWTCGLAGERVAAVAGALAAFAWPLVHQEVQVSAAGLATFLVAAALAAGAWAERGHPFRMAAPGVLVGLAGIAHGMALAFVLVLALPLLQRTRRAAAACAIGLALAAVPPLMVCAHNAGVDDGAYALQANVGLNAWIGNGEGANGYPNVPQGERYDALVNEAYLADALTAAEHDRFFRRKTLSWMFAHPLRWLGLVGRKLAATWSAEQVDSSMDSGIFEDRLALDALAFVRWGWLAGLAVPGAILLWRRSPRRLAWLAAVLAATIPLALLVTSARYRAPLALPLIAAAAVALEAAWTGRRRLASRAGAALAGAAVAGAALSYANLTGVASGDYFAGDRQLGSSYARGQDWARAEEHLLRAWRAAPSDPDALRALAALYFVQGRREEALKWARAALDAGPASLQTLVQGTAILAAGRREEEIDAAWARAVALSPRDARFYARWGEFKLGAGRYAEAAELLQKSIALQPRSRTVQANCGGAFLALRRWPEAEARYRAVLDADPFHAEANYGMAVARAEQGDPQGAIRYAREAAESGHPDAPALLLRLGSPP
ncbi:MAG: tetratricopeptide repeat protein [Planctomycetes bacterium]|nr:tetratricopeptide repeat protein [Planctomycetota bacterium]